MDIPELDLDDMQDIVPAIADPAQGDIEPGDNRRRNSAAEWAYL